LVSHFQFGQGEVMASFDERAKAYEAEFAHREELRFKVRERAIRLLALWAAERLGKSGRVGEAYAKDIVAMDVTSLKSDDAIGRVVADLHASGVSEQEVRRAMDRFLAQADATLRGHVS
jgi:hypothetical protein